MYEKLSTLPSETESDHFPFMSVTVPFPVPFTVTDTPIRGSPVLSVMIPRTSFSFDLLES